MIIRLIAAFSFLFFCNSNPVFSTTKIHKVYLDSNKSTVFFETANSKKDILISDQNLSFTIEALSSDKEWVILSSLEKDYTGVGRAGIVRILLYIPLKKTIPDQIVDYPLTFEKGSKGEFVVSMSGDVNLKKLKKVVIGK